MKKFICFILTALLVFAGGQVVTAQRALTFPVVSADTLSNTDTTSKVLQITAGYSGIAIQPVITRLSGTAAGKVYLFESLDGVNYGLATDSITLSNQVTNTVIWKKAAPNPVFYRIQATSSGTVSQAVRIHYVLRKHD